GFPGHRLLRAGQFLADPAYRRAAPPPPAVVGGAGAEPGRPRHRGTHTNPSRPDPALRGRGRSGDGGVEAGDRGRDSAARRRFCVSVRILQRDGQATGFRPLHRGLLDHSRLRHLGKRPAGPGASRRVLRPLALAVSACIRGRRTSLRSPQASRPRPAPLGASAASAMRRSNGIEQRLPGPAFSLSLAAWWGLSAGLVEVAVSAARRVNTPLMDLGRDYAWMIPLALSGVFLLLGLCVFLMGRLWSWIDSRVITTFLCSSLAFLDLLMLVPRLHHLAALILALG